MPDGTGREQDLVLDPRQYAYVLDSTKGTVIVHAGPCSVTLSQQQQPVVYERETFRRVVRLEEAIQSYPVAAEGDYVELQNLAADDREHPAQGAGNQQGVDLQMGQKINTPGPTSFALWPGQVARVIPGHQLRSNQYLVARVYNEEKARSDLGRMVLRPAEGDEDGDVRARIGGELTMGKLLVIKGTDTSFFIPPTGIEVLADEGGEYVRGAVSLEALEYCILVDENGRKRYERGPAVVFPEPTETFRRAGEGDGSRKFRAIELNEISGLHIKVIADHEDYREGDELFITGKEQRIYFPRAEHAVVRYGDGDGRVFAVAVPEGEGRYVMDRLGKGDRLVTLVKGPAMILPDPRKDVLVRRVLCDRDCALWFPGNVKAVDHNRALRKASEKESEEKTSGGMVSERVARKAFLSSASSYAMGSTAFRTPASAEQAVDDFAGDEMRRKTVYTPPRTVTLDTKFDGAVVIDVWTNYAILVKDKRGNREVVVGPATRLLEYDETLEVLSLSTGKPKNTDELLRTVYLRVRNNIVSDIISAETSDLVPVRIKVVHRLNFVGDDPETWFGVENYVKHVCDHVRSMVRNHVKHLTTEEFVDDAVAKVRDMVLGESADGERPGLKFEENGCHVHDVEVLDVKIGDEFIGDMLVEARHVSVRRTIEVKQERIELEAKKESLRLERERLTVEAETARKREEVEIERDAAKCELEMSHIRGQTSREEAKQLAEEARQNVLDEQARGDRERSQASNEMRAESRRRDNVIILDLQRGEATVRMEEVEKTSAAVRAEIEAITPRLVAALQTHGDKLVTAEIVEKMTPLATLTGEDVPTTARRVLQGTVLAEMLPSLGVGGFGLRGTDENGS